MAGGKIFIRKRHHVAQGLAIVAVANTDLEIVSQHVSKMEIEQIAERIGAELIFLETGKDEEDFEI